MKTRLKNAIRISVTILIMVVSSHTYSDDDRQIYTIEKFSIGSLRKNEMISDCGCSFHYHPATLTESSYPILEWSDGEDASMFINGTLRKLKITSQDQYTDKLGDSTSFKLESTEFTILGNLKASWVCPASDTSCEVVKYVGSLNITSKTGNAIVPVTGACGC